MKEVKWKPATREILAITYQVDFIFESNSAALKPSAYAEIGRVAHMISLFPQMTIDVEVTSDTTGFKTDCGTLRKKRIQAIKKFLLREGIEARRLRTTVQKTIHGTPQTLSSEGTVHFRVSYDIIDALNDTSAVHHISPLSYDQAGNNSVYAA